MIQIDPQTYFKDIGIPNQIIAKPGLTATNFVCDSVIFDGKASPNWANFKLFILLQ